MFYCNSCKEEFQNPTVLFRKLENTDGYQSVDVCPACGSDDIVTMRYTHCKCCGVKLTDASNPYCSESCKQRGNFLYKKQNAYNKRMRASSVFSVVREIDDYNKKHHTKYSYGSYVALIKK